MFHHQHPISTSFSHTRDVEACVAAEPLQASERAHTCRLPRTIAFVRQFLFHNLSHLSLIYCQLHPFSMKNNEVGSTANVLFRNSTRGSSRPAAKLGVCVYSSGRSPRSPLCFGNWTFTVTRSGRPVGETRGTGTAWSTCPIEAAAKGIGLNFANEGRYGSW
jgi:hypothetical protein